MGCFLFSYNSVKIVMKNIIINKCNPMPKVPREKWLAFSRIWRKSDCSDVIANYRSRIRTVIRRLECNDEGRVFEDYHCWGCAEGGRTYNPCGGGSC